MTVKPDFNHWVQNIANWVQNLPPAWETVIHVSFILLIVILASAVTFIVFHSFYHRLKKTHNIWDDILLYSLHKPLQALIWMLGIVFMFQAVLSIVPKLNWDQGFTLTREAIIVLTVFWFVARYIRLFEERLSQPREGSRRRFDKATTFAVSKLLRVAVVLIAALFLLQVFGVPLSGLIAFGGASAIVVGIAAKDILANFFGSIMIFTDRPFTVGDWISSPDRKIEGTVEHIGWRLTKIRSFARRPMYVPNSLFSNVVVVNDQRMYNRRIKTNIGVRYDDVGKVKAITEAITAMLKAHPEVDQRQVTYVRLVEFAAYSVNIQIYTFTKTTDWLKFMAIQEEIYLTIAEIIAEHGAEFAFPTQTVEVPKGLSVTNPSIGDQ